MGRLSRFTTTGLLFLSALLPSVALAGEIDAADLLSQVLSALPKVPFVAQLRLSTASGPRELNLSHKLINGVRSSYLEVTEPADLNGMRFLFIEHRDKAPEQYIKVTASRRSVLVTGEARNQPFLGSNFCVSDLIEPDIDSARHRYVGEDTVLGRRCRVIESIPIKHTAALYGRTMAALDPKDLLVLKREFFDQKDRLLKVWQVTKLQKINDTWTVMDQTMTNVQERTTSRLEVVDLKLDVDLPDTMFTPAYLLH